METRGMSCYCDEPTMTRKQFLRSRLKTLIEIPDDGPRYMRAMIPFRILIFVLTFTLLSLLVYLVSLPVPELRDTTAVLLVGVTCAFLFFAVIHVIGHFGASEQVEFPMIFGSFVGIVCFTFIGAVIAYTAPTKSWARLISFVMCFCIAFLHAGDVLLAIAYWRYKYSSRPKCGPGQMVDAPMGGYPMDFALRAPSSQVYGGHTRSYVSPSKTYTTTSNTYNVAPRTAALAPVAAPPEICRCNAVTSMTGVPQQLQPIEIHQDHLSRNYNVKKTAQGTFMECPIYGPAYSNDYPMVETRAMLSETTSKPREVQATRIEVKETSTTPMPAEPNCSLCHRHTETNQTRPKQFGVQTRDLVPSKLQTTATSPHKPIPLPSPIHPKSSSTPIHENRNLKIPDTTEPTSAPCCGSCDCSSTATKPISHRPRRIPNIPPLKRRFGPAKEEDTDPNMNLYEELDENRVKAPQEADETPLSSKKSKPLIGKLASISTCLAKNSSSSSSLLVHKNKRTQTKGENTTKNIVPENNEIYENIEYQKDEKLNKKKHSVDEVEVRSIDMNSSHDISRIGVQSSNLDTTYEMPISGVTPNPNFGAIYDVPQVKTDSGKLSSTRETPKIKKRSLNLDPTYETSKSGVTQNSSWNVTENVPKKEVGIKNLSSSRTMSKTKIRSPSLDSASKIPTSGVVQNPNFSVTHNISGAKTGTENLSATQNTSKDTRGSGNLSSSLRTSRSKDRSSSLDQTYRAPSSAAIRNANLSPTYDVPKAASGTGSLNSSHHTSRNKRGSSNLITSHETLRTKNRNSNLDTTYRAPTSETVHNSSFGATYDVPKKETGTSNLSSTHDTSRVDRRNNYLNSAQETSKTDKHSSNLKSSYETSKNEDRNSNLDQTYGTSTSGTVRNANFGATYDVPKKEIGTSNLSSTHDTSRVDRRSSYSSPTQEMSRNKRSSDNLSTSHENSRAKDRSSSLETEYHSPTSRTVLNTNFGATYDVPMAEVGTSNLNSAHVVSKKEIHGGHSSSTHEMSGTVLGSTKTKAMPRAPESLPQNYIGGASSMLNNEEITRKSTGINEERPHSSERSSTAVDANHDSYMSKARTKTLYRELSTPTKTKNENMEGLNSKLENNFSAEGKSPDRMLLIQSPDIGKPSTNNIAMEPIEKFASKKMEDGITKRNENSELKNELNIQVRAEAAGDTGKRLRSDSGSSLFRPVQMSKITHEIIQMKTLSTPRPHREITVNKSVVESKLIKEEIPKSIGPGGINSLNNKDDTQQAMKVNIIGNSIHKISCPLCNRSKLPCSHCSSHDAKN